MENELLRKAKILEPVLRIGKNGINDNVFSEVDKLLKKRKLIKIKVLPNCPEDAEEIITKILDKSGSVLVLKIGKTFVVYRR
jgi:RNA-binding protein